MVDPLFQRVLVKECRNRKIPVVFDEVFTGFWRLGVEVCWKFCLSTFSYLFSFLIFSFLFYNKYLTSEFSTSLQLSYFIVHLI